MAILPIWFKCILRTWRDTRNLASLLATCEKKSVRDAKRAVEAATIACKLTNWGDDSLDTLAAACAEARDFKSAVRTVRLTPMLLTATRCYFEVNARDINCLRSELG